MQDGSSFPRFLKDFCLYPAIRTRCVGSFSLHRAARNSTHFPLVYNEGWGLKTCCSNGDVHPTQSRNYPHFILLLRLGRKILFVKKKPININNIQVVPYTCYAVFLARLRIGFGQHIRPQSHVGFCKEPPTLSRSGRTYVRTTRHSFDKNFHRYNYQIRKCHLQIDHYPESEQQELCRRQNTSTTPFEHFYFHENLKTTRKKIRHRLSPSCSDSGWWLHLLIW